MSHHDQVTHWIARSCSFISRLLDSDVPIKSTNMPDTGKMMLQILGAVAENEARSCSERTRAALAAAKARGVVLGNPRNLRRGNPEWCARNREIARQVAEGLRRHVGDLRAAGITTFSAMAKAESERGVSTPSGGT